MGCIRKRRKKHTYLYVDEYMNEWEGIQMEITQFLLPGWDKTDEEDAIEIEQDDTEQDDTESGLASKNADCIQWYDEYMSGTLSRTEYTEKMYIKLEGFIKYFLQKQGLHAQSKEDYEDMFASGVQRLVEDIDSYNPRKAMPTTWFASHLYKCVMLPSGITTHYNNIIRKLNRVAKENGYEDASDADLEPHRLAILADESLATVTRALKLNSVNIVADSDTMQLNGGITASPETAYLEKERTEFVGKMFNILSPLEKMVISMYINDDDEKKSDAKILKAINTPKNLKLFKLKKPLNPQSLNKIKNVALMKMREHSGSYLFENKERSYVYEDREQATTEDIMEAFDEGILF